EEVEDYLAGFPADYTNWPNQVSENDRLMMKIEKVDGSEGHRLLFDRESKRGDYVLMSGLNPPASVVLNLEDLNRIKFSLSVASWAKVCGGQARVSVGPPDGPADVTLLKAGDSKVYDLTLSDSKRLAISSEGEGGTSCNRVFLNVLEKE
ncbi:hypothetical protein LJB99_07020, partial [Deltaproteobacteria bacterium OttesenSCG-928-K17]|nr:hypothetical protein [Deltaproteobacteria bacterium OttesenSCG-928-K17]